jgi:hypothetical protein
MLSTLISLLALLIIFLCNLEYSSLMIRVHASNIAQTASPPLCPFRARFSALYAVLGLVVVTVVRFP